jgi:hypothetical protein
MCREDVLFYINAFVWQFNPRKLGSSVGPFITWDFQETATRQILDAISCDCHEDSETHQHDLLIEKSREMGASWLCLIIMEWLWHFHPWNKFLCISRNEKAVEDEDPDSLFWKIDFIQRYQPTWLLPTIKRRKLYFGNEDNGSTITGQASTGKAGVGGRATAMFIDEFSQIDEAFEVLHRTSDTTGCRIFNGTHRGIGTAFHELSLRADQRKLVMHWTQHPEKNRGLYRYDSESNRVEVFDKLYSYPVDYSFVLADAPAGGPRPGIRSPWYDQQCLRKGSSRAIAMDLDIDPGGSVAQFFNPLTIRVLRQSYCCPPFWEGEISYDRDSGKPLSLVQNEGGPLRLWIRPKSDSSVARAKYAAGADISTGGGATNSVISMANASTGEKVLEYATANMNPDKFAVVCVALCWLFKDENGEPALFAWEHHGPGLAFGARVLELGYRNIYWREAHQKLAGGKVSNVPGWYPSNDTKRLLLEDYRAALDAREIINRSDEALRECLPYRYTPQGTVEHPHDQGGDDPTGARINHGDRVIADALSWMMCKKRVSARAKKEAEEEQCDIGTLAWRRLIHKHFRGSEKQDPWGEPVANKSSGW